MSIPHIIHRIWLGDKPLPSEFEAFGRTWETWHPGWTSILWTDATLPPLANQRAYDRSAVLSGKSNVARYEILCRYGGIYVDTDFECLRNIEPLIEHVDCFLAHERDIPMAGGRVALMNNAIIGSTPEHPFLQDLIRQLEPRLRGIPDSAGSNFQSGPFFVSGVLQHHPEVRVFPPQLFYPYEYHERWRRHERFPDAYAVHHWTLSGTASLPVRAGKLCDDRNGRCLSVILVPASRDHGGLRLRWVLEGLRRQTTDDFEVFVLIPAAARDHVEICRLFEDRLDLAWLIESDAIDPQAARALVVQAALERARAPRTLLLDADCLPDPEVVEQHALHFDWNLVLYGLRRVYPLSKFFPFRDAVDYGSVWRHSCPEHEGEYIAPWRPRRTVPTYCWSAPSGRLRDAVDVGDRWSPDRTEAVVEHVLGAGCAAKPCIRGMVTWMGPV